MKNHVYVACLLCVSSAHAAAADWQLAARNEDALYYVDIESIRPKVGYTQAWVRTDFLIKQEDGGRSKKSLIKFNCEEELMSVASTTTYTEAGGGGESSTEAETNQKYTPMPPDTIGDAILKYVCNSMRMIR